MEAQSTIANEDIWDVLLVQYDVNVGSTRTYDQAANITLHIGGRVPLCTKAWLIRNQP